MNPPISVVIHTLNEQANIKNCLESIKWADEIIIVDMLSEDKTVEIASKYTDKIFTYQRCGYADPARQFGLEKTTNEWVLAIDADEMVPQKLHAELIRLSQNNSCDLVWIPMKNYLFGQIINGCGWGVNQVWHLRFFKKSYVCYSDKIHNYLSVIRPNARCLRLIGEELAMVHFNYIDFEHFIEKLNRYTTIEAKTAFLSGKKFDIENIWKDIFHQINEIAITKEGLNKDGIYGLGLGVLMAMYHFTVKLKLFAMETFNNIEPGIIIRKQYQKIANDIIEEYNTPK